MTHQHLIPSPPLTCPGLVSQYRPQLLSHSHHKQCTSHPPACCMLACQHKHSDVKQATTTAQCTRQEQSSIMQPTGYQPARPSNQASFSPLTPQQPSAHMPQPPDCIPAAPVAPPAVLPARGCTATGCTASTAAIQPIPRPLTVAC